MCAAANAPGRTNKHMDPTSDEHTTTISHKSHSHVLLMLSRVLSLACASRVRGSHYLSANSESKDNYLSQWPPGYSGKEKRDLSMLLMGTDIRIISLSSDSCAITLTVSITCICRGSITNNQAFYRQRAFLQNES